ncbi:MAG: hypothetical protein IIW14_02280, partial [Kiritimatiellae bacterium]|nr:hypothetical protein [Kiritimatiellia bacterium]
YRISAKRKYIARREPYIASHSDILRLFACRHNVDRPRRATYRISAKRKYIARRSRISHRSVILPAAEFYYGLRRSFIEACGFSVILFALKLTEGQ